MGIRGPRRGASDNANAPKRVVTMKMPGQGERAWRVCAGTGCPFKSGHGDTPRPAYEVS